MEQVFLLNGAGYRLRTRKSEEELQRMVEDHYKDIFGQESIFFSFEPKLRSAAGIGLRFRYIVFYRIPFLKFFNHINKKLGFDLFLKSSEIFQHLIKV